MSQRRENSPSTITAGLYSTKAKGKSEKAKKVRSLMSRGLRLSLALSFLLLPFHFLLTFYLLMLGPRLFLLD